MDSTATVQVKTKPGRKEHVTALAEAVARFTAPVSADAILAEIPTVMVGDFGAARSELWLWDHASGSAYLTHVAGRDAAHRRDFVAPGAGPVGVVLQTQAVLENKALAILGAEELDFGNRSRLSHVAAYPLLAKGELLGVIANYTSAPVEPELLSWWQVYSRMTSIATHEVLTAQKDQKAITQLSLLLEATRLLNSTLDLAELLELILKIARTEVHADRGTVFLVDAKRQQLWSIVASGLGDHEEIRMPFGGGVAGHVAQTGEVVNVEDAYALEYFDRSFDQKFGYTTRSLLCLPIRHKTGHIVGVIQLLNATTGRFSNDDEDFLNKLSGHMAMALENAQLHREALEKQRLEKELALACGIQRGLLPAAPVEPGYDIAVANRMCPEVGGDYYDFLNLGPQSLLLVVADVEGKGLSSAMMMSNLQATLRALVMHLHSLEVLTLSLNEMIYNDSRSEKFLSIFLGLVDTRGNLLHYINAGHVPPMLIDQASGEYQLLEEGGTVIGLFPNAEYTSGMVQFRPGDLLVCCTDGVLDTTNCDEEEYGQARLARAVYHHREKPAEEIVSAVLAEVNAFSGNRIDADDKVLMVAKVAGKAPGTAGLD